MTTSTAGSATVSIRPEPQPIALTTLAADLLFKRPGWKEHWQQYKTTQPAIARRRLPWLINTLLVCWVASQHVALCPVTTQSVDAHLVLVIKGAMPQRGDFVAFRYSGQSFGTHHKGDGILKVVAGLPGDRIDRVGRDFYVGGRFLGHAKESTGMATPSWFYQKQIEWGWAPKPADRPLQATAPCVIPNGFIYAQGTDRDALDSRYAEMGLVPMASFIGRAVKLF